MTDELLDDAADARHERFNAAHRYWLALPEDQRQACHIAGLALYMYGELPAVEDAEGYMNERYTREVVNVAHYILPGQCYLSPPEDHEEFAARVKIARALVSDAGSANANNQALLKIAGDALDWLAGILGLARLAEAA